MGTQVDETSVIGVETTGVEVVARTPVHQRMLRSPEAQLTQGLCALLGLKLVAYIGSDRETRAVRQ